MKPVVVAFLLIGTLLHHRCQALVYTEDNERDFFRKCSKVLQTPAEIMKQIDNRQDPISDDREMHCLVRCFGILSGFYDDGIGIDWDLVKRQLESLDGFEKHRKATIECVQGLPEEEVQLGVCRMAYLSFRCLVESARKRIREKS